MGLIDIFIKKEFLGFTLGLSNVLRLLQEGKAEYRFSLKMYEAEWQNYQITYEDFSIEISWLYKNNLLPSLKFKVDGIEVSRKYYEYDILKEIRECIFDDMRKKYEDGQKEKYEEISDKLKKINSSITYFDIRGI